MRCPEQGADLGDVACEAELLISALEFWRDDRAVFLPSTEIESRLPIRVQFVSAADAAYEQTKTLRYNEAKKSARDVEFQPSKWDYGTEASQSNWETPAAKPAADFKA